jgi:hypothetical protein
MNLLNLIRENQVNYMTMLNGLNNNSFSFDIDNNYITDNTSLKLQTNNKKGLFENLKNYFSNKESNRSVKINNEKGIINLDPSIKYKESKYKYNLI